MNAAYSTLRCPHKRAVYMLRRMGMDFEDQTSNTDPEFMMDVSVSPNSTRALCIIHEDELQHFAGMRSVWRIVALMRANAGDGGEHRDHRRRPGGNLEGAERVRSPLLRQRAMWVALSTCTEPRLMRAMQVLRATDGGQLQRGCRGVRSPGSSPCESRGQNPHSWDRVCEIVGFSVWFRIVYPVLCCLRRSFYRVRC